MTFDHDTDVLLDLGSGTGNLAHSIKKQAKLRHNVICVEPNEMMVSVASHLEGINVIQTTAQEFATKAITSVPHFNKVLIAFCSHHFTDSRELVFSKLSEALPQGGLILIIDRQREPALPLFQKALEKHRQAHANDLCSEQYSILAQPLGFVVNSNDMVLRYTVTKQLWYRTLRERFISYLYWFTDEQLEDGIKELEAIYSTTNEILIKDSIVIHTLIKKY